jgi:peroxidase
MGGSKVISSTATAATAAHGAVVAICSWGVLVLLLLSAVGTVQCLHSSPTTPAGLSEDFYKDSCPEVFDIVSAGVALATLTDFRLPASLLRVSFHDCWIGVIGFSPGSPSSPLSTT